MSGNAYALLSLYHVTKDDLYKCRAQQFGQFMADHWKELKDVPDAPLSLYEVRLCKLNRRSAYLQMASITNPITQFAVVCLLTSLLVDLWHLPESAVRLRIYAISSIY